MLAHRLRRWHNIETSLGEFPVFAGKCPKDWTNTLGYCQSTLLKFLAQLWALNGDTYMYFYLLKTAWKTLTHYALTNELIMHDICIPRKMPII